MRKIKIWSFMALAVLCITSLFLYACVDANGDPTVPTQDELAGFDVPASATAEIGIPYKILSFNVKDDNNNSYSVDATAVRGQTTIPIIGNEIEIDSFEEYKVTYTVTVGENKFSKATQISVADTTAPVIKGSINNVFFGDVIDLSVITVEDNSKESITPQIKVTVDDTDQEITVAEDNTFTAPQQTSGVSALKISITAIDSNQNQAVRTLTINLMEYTASNNYWSWNNLGANTLPVTAVHSAEGINTTIDELKIVELNDGRKALEIGVPAGLPVNTQIKIEMSNIAKLTALNDNWKNFETFNIEVKAYDAKIRTTATNVMLLAGKYHNTFAEPSIGTDNMRTYNFSYDLTETTKGANWDFTSVTTGNFYFRFQTWGDVTTENSKFYLVEAYGGMKDIQGNADESFDLSINGFDGVTATYQVNGGDKVDIDNLSDFTPVSGGQYIIEYTLIKEGYLDTVVAKNIDIVATTESNNYWVWDNLGANTLPVTAVYLEDGKNITVDTFEKVVTLNDGRKALEISLPSGLPVNTQIKIEMSNIAKLTALNDNWKNFETFNIEVKAYDAKIRTNATNVALLAGKFYNTFAEPSVGADNMRTYNYCYDLTETTKGANWDFTSVTTSNFYFRFQTWGDVTTDNSKFYLVAAYGGMKDEVGYTGESMDLTLDGFDQVTATYQLNGGTKTAISDLTDFTPTSTGQYKIEYNLVKAGYLDTVITKNINIVVKSYANNYWVWDNLGADTLPVTAAGSTNGISTNVVTLSDGRKALEISVPSGLPVNTQIRVEMSNIAKLTALNNNWKKFETFNIEVKASDVKIRTDARTLMLLAGKYHPTFSEPSEVNGMRTYNFSYDLTDTSDTNLDFTNVTTGNFYFRFQTTGSATTANSKFYLVAAYGGMKDEVGYTGESMDLTLGGFDQVTATYQVDGGTKTAISDLTDFTPASTGQYTIEYNLVKAGYLDTVITKNINVIVKSYANNYWVWDNLGANTLPVTAANSTDGVSTNVVTLSDGRRALEISFSSGLSAGTQIKIDMTNIATLTAMNDNWDKFETFNIEVKAYDAKIRTNARNLMLLAGKYHPDKFDEPPLDSESMRTYNFSYDLTDTSETNLDFTSVTTSSNFYFRFQTNAVTTENSKLYLVAAYGGMKDINGVEGVSTDLSIGGFDQVTATYQVGDGTKTAISDLSNFTPDAAGEYTIKQAGCLDTVITRKLVVAESGD